MLSFALALAIYAQHLLTPWGGNREFARLPRDHVAIAFSLLFAAGCMAAFAVWRSEGVAVRRTAPAGVLDLAEVYPYVLAAVLMVLSAALLVLADYDSPWAVYLWGGGLFAMLIGAGRAEAHRGAAVTQDPLAGAEWLVLALILTAGVALRAWDLTSIPSQVHGDEAACGLEARHVLRGEIANLLSIGWYDIPYISFAISAAFMKALGDDLFGLRSASVTLGSASLVVSYFLARRLYGRRVAAIAASLLAVSHWHIHFSRIGTNYMQALFATVVAFFFFVRARQRGRSADWMACGLAIGLASTVYFAGRITIVVVAIYLLAERLSTPRRERRIDRGVALMAVAALVFVVPTVAAIAWWPSAVTERTQGVFVLSQGNLEHTYRSHGIADAAGLVRHQVGRTLTAFNWSGDSSAQHSHAAPLLDFWSAPIFAVAAIAFTALSLSPRYRLLGLWLWSTLVLGSLLTVDPLFSPRVVVALPAIFIFCALLLARLWALAEAAFGAAGRRGGGLAVVAVLGAAAVANYQDYFDLHVHRLQATGLHTIQARYIRGVNADYRAYVVGDQRLDYETSRFLLPDFDGADAGAALPPLPLSTLGSKGAAFVIDASWPDGVDAERTILAHYPAARRTVLYRDDGKAAFTVLLVEAADLHGALNRPIARGSRGDYRG